MTDERGGDEPTQERLDQLDERIDDVADRLAEEEGQVEERRFVDPGEIGPVDDAIVPPG